MQEKLKKYSEFINVFTKTVDGFFEEQKEFIKCSSGCSICCQTGYYPFTEIEYEFLKIGFNSLEKETQDIIYQRAIEIYKNRKIFTQNGNELSNFSYTCPYLFDDLCSLYQHRGIICRTYGLISISARGENQFNMPTCLNKGLNYTNIWDEKIKGFSFEKAQALNLKSSPQAYPVRYESILKTLDYIDTGDIRMLFEWIIMDIPNYQEILNSIN